MHEQLKSTIQKAGKNLLDGAEEDLKVFLDGIDLEIRSTLTAKPEDREALLEELYGQIRLVGEINRIRASNEGWDLFQSAVQIAVTAAIAAL